MIILASFFKFTVLSHADEECYISVATPQPLSYCYKAVAEFRETSQDKHIKKLGIIWKCTAPKDIECNCGFMPLINAPGCLFTITLSMFIFMYIYQIRMV